MFVDTGVFVAFHNTKDEHHERARDLVTKIVQGEFGAAYTSDYVFDEAVTLAIARARRASVAFQVGKMILGEGTRRFVVILKVSEDAFREAWSVFQKHFDRGLSFTDSTSISLMRERDVERIASFDSSFDGLVPRVY